MINLVLELVAYHHVPLAGCRKTLFVETEYFDIIFMRKNTTLDTINMENL